MLRKVLNHQEWWWLFRRLALANRTWPAGEHGRLVFHRPRQYHLFTRIWARTRAIRRSRPSSTLETFEPRDIMAMVEAIGTTRESKITSQPSWWWNIYKAEAVPTHARARALAIRGIKPTPYRVGHLTLSLKISVPSFPIKNGPFSATSRLNSLRSCLESRSSNDDRHTHRDSSRKQVAVTHRRFIWKERGCGTRRSIKNVP